MHCLGKWRRFFWSEDENSDVTGRAGWSNVRSLDRNVTVGQNGPLCCPKWERFNNVTWNVSVIYGISRSSLVVVIYAITKSSLISLFVIKIMTPLCRHKKAWGWLHNNTFWCAADCFDYSYDQLLRFGIVYRVPVVVKKGCQICEPNDTRVPRVSTVFQYIPQIFIRLRNKI